MSWMVTALGAVRVMEAGVVVILCVVEVSNLSHTVTFRLLHSDNIFYTQWKCCKVYSFFLLVTCPLLTAPINGMTDCSLGGDGIPNSGDVCSFTCNIGYEVTGSNTRTCQDDGSWSDSHAMCSRGEYLFKHNLIKYILLYNDIQIYNESVVNILSFG